MPAKIPGYVYDEGKRKYFKILPDHAVPPASSYSRTAVAEGERRKEHLLVRDELHQRKLRQQVQRSVILGLYPLGGFVGVQREHGSHEGRIATAKAQIWAKGLSQKTLTARNDPFPPLRNPSGAIRHFVHEPNTGAIISAPDWTGIRRALSSLELYVPVLNREATPLTFKRYHMDHARSIGLGTSPEISSLSISPDCVVLATALGREQPPTLHTIQMKPALQVEGRDDRPHIATTIANIDLSGAIRRSGFNTLWASAAGPHQGDYNEFAVGTSNGILHFRVGGDRYSEQESRWPGDEHSADTFAVDFWGSSSVLAGMRSGKVRLWDTRSQGVNVRFQHASSVVDIKTLDQNRILVAGLKDKLCIYDARFNKAFPQSQQTEALPPSRPIHTFPNYYRKSFVHPKLGFDVHENLIAVGTEDKKIQLFDIKSGREVAFGNQPDPTTVDRYHARCLKFVGDEDRGDGLRLLVANGSCIDAWTW